MFFLRAALLMLLANRDMAPLKPQLNGRVIAFVQWMGLLFLSGIALIFRNIGTHRSRKTYVFVNQRLERNPVQTMKAIMTSTDSSEAGREIRTPAIRWNRWFYQLLLLAIGGCIFVGEAASFIMQRAWFRNTKARFGQNAHYK
jgi:hypothetical protein